jgi:uncharacterized protein YrrD
LSVRALQLIIYRFNFHEQEGKDMDQDRDLRNREVRNVDLDRDDRPVESSETGNIQPDTVKNLRGKTIISIDTGEKIGNVDDVYVDRQALRVSGLVVAKGGIFNREMMIVPAESIEKWGKDTILVNNPGAMRPAEEVSGRENWLSANEKLTGLTIISAGGDRIGQLEDLLIDDTGKITAYRVSEGMGPAAFGTMREIPAHMTRALGKDVAIVEMDGSR